MLTWNLAICPEMTISIRIHQNKFEDLRSKYEAGPAFFKFRPFIKENRPYFGKDV